ncbi:hypothetical protein C8R42DRAFT_598555 [Lentinula raphanica]|nr:hypothetical protein C8R42DRAFT_598555 [Lentinula raphanica]
MVSRSWIRKFQKRHKDVLKSARGSGLDPKRAQAFNAATVNRYFEILDGLIRDNDIPWCNIYNMDEKGVQLGGGRKNSQEKYFFDRQDTAMYRQHSDNLELVTIIDSVCADETAEIFPAFVFAGATKFSEWMEVDNRIL